MTRCVGKYKEFQPPLRLIVISALAANLKYESQRKARLFIHFVLDIQNMSTSLQVEEPDVVDEVTAPTTLLDLPNELLLLVMRILTRKLSSTLASLAGR
jgi:hypothetical protein